MDSKLLQVSEQVEVPPTTTTTGTLSVASWPHALLRDLLETVLPALFIAVLMVVFVIQPTRVDGISMEPTLHSEQRLVIEKVSYRFHAPVLGDVIVLKLPGRENSPLIKRVVATAGDVIAIRNGQVFLNGEPLTESYLAQLTPGDVPSTVVPEGLRFRPGRQPWGQQRQPPFRDDPHRSCGRARARQLLAAEHPRLGKIAHTLHLPKAAPPERPFCLPCDGGTPRVAAYLLLFSLPRTHYNEQA